MSWPPGLIEMDRKAMTSSLFPPFARELDCVLRLDLKCRRKGVIADARDYDSVCIVAWTVEPRPDRLCVFVLSPPRGDLG
jgi:hypothetical protein